MGDLVYSNRAALARFLVSPTEDFADGTPSRKTAREAELPASP